MAAPKGHQKWGGKPKGYKTPARRAREAGEAKALKQLEMSAERGMLETARVAFVDRTGIWDDTGGIKPFSEWTPDQRQLVEGIEVIRVNAAGGDGHTDTVHKLHLVRKWPAVEAVLKHFGLITDKHEVTIGASEELLAKLDAIKARNRR